jgi:hypothetical protein
VEKIPLIHSSARVYYHHYLYFLSKLTKEGKVSGREKSNAGTARPLFCLQEEQDAPVASRQLPTPFYMPNMQAKRPHRLQKHLDCGKPPAYPQDWMCKKTVFLASGFFVQHRFSIDTMLFQPIRERVNH